MNVSKLLGSTAVDKALKISTASGALIANTKDNRGAQGQAEKPVREISSGVELTAGTVSKYLQNISADSCDEIDALIGDLRGLREKLVADGGRIERELVNFATLNQSVIKLTEVVVDGVTHVKAPSFAE